jgi:hypothetical protein
MSDDRNVPVEFKPDTITHPPRRRASFGFGSHSSSPGWFTSGCNAEAAAPWVEPGRQFEHLMALKCAHLLSKPPTLVLPDTRDR